MRKLAPKLALFCAAALVCFALAEFAVRAIYGGRYAQRPSFLEPHPELGWRPQANLHHTFFGSDFQTDIATDERGYRLGRLGAWTEAQSLILLGGDSYTFGWGVSTDETWASLLDERVSAESDGAIRVANLGVGGYGTTQTSRRVASHFEHTASHFERPAPPPVRAVVMLHSHNDFSDDVAFLAVSEGFRRLKRVPPNGSRFHLITFVRQALRRWREGEGARAFRDGRRRDALFHVALEEADRSAGGVAVGSLHVPKERLFADAEGQRPTLERKALTPLQSALLAESLDRLHRAAPHAGVVCLHAAIHSAPDWYVEAVREAVEVSAMSVGRRARFVGRVPATDEFKRRFENAHSGHHFTPELNAYYATKIVAWLEAEGVL